MCVRESERQRESVHLSVRKREKERAIERENKIKREKKENSRVRVIVR